LDAGLPLAIVSQVIPCFLDDGAQLDTCVADYLRVHLESVQTRMEALNAQQGTIRRLQQLVVP
jgi:hypothetical protein